MRNNINLSYYFSEDDKQIIKEGHKGIICTAGNSATGRAMLGVCLAYNIPVISIVRNNIAKSELAPVTYSQTTKIPVGKTIKINGRPWKFAVELNYYVTHYDTFGPQWMIGVNIAPVVKNVIANWIN